MSKSATVHSALVGDFRPDVTAHQAIGPALTLAGRDLDIDVHFTWHRTADLGSYPEDRLRSASGIWCVLSCKPRPAGGVHRPLHEIRSALQDRGLNLTVACCDHSWL